MAIFTHNNQSIAYHVHPAPSEFDILLLQSSRYTTSYWQPVLDIFARSPAEGGRIVICEWHNQNSNTDAMGEALRNMVKTVGFQNLHVVACGDAVRLIQDSEARFPGPFERHLFYPGEFLPPSEELDQAIRGFLKT